MARINQATFKKYLNQYRDVRTNYDQLLLDYFDEDDNFLGDYLTVWSFFDNANQIYCESESLANILSSILTDYKFEEFKTEKKYISIKEELISIKNEMKCKFDTIFASVDHSFSDVELRTLDKMKIYT